MYIQEAIAVIFRNNRQKKQENKEKANEKKRAVSFHE